MAASMFGGRPNPINSAAVPSNRGLSGAAYDLVTSPVNLFRRVVSRGGPGPSSGADAAAAAQGDSNNIGIGANSNMEISRLSLHYSSANLSEEESSSLINILDRKKYHERITAHRSAEEQIQPRYVL